MGHVEAENDVEQTALDDLNKDLLRRNEQIAQVCKNSKLYQSIQNSQMFAKMFTCSQIYALQADSACSQIFATMFACSQIFLLQQTRYVLKYLQQCLYVLKYLRCKQTRHVIQLWAFSNTILFENNFQSNKHASSFSR